LERNARLVQYCQHIHNEIVASMNIYDHDQRHRRPTPEYGTFERNARLDASESPWPGPVRPSAERLYATAFKVSTHANTTSGSIARKT